MSRHSLRGRNAPALADASTAAAAQPSVVVAGRRPRMARTLASGLAVAAIGVGALALPGATSTHPTPTTAATSDARTVEYLAARQPGTSRDAARDAVDAPEVAARAQVLSETRALIDAEAERLAVQDTFFWPTAGGIASPWGMRLHPILHYKRLHGGADIGGEAGAPIYATLDGTITKAATGYNSGSGNNIRIDHGTIDGEQLETAYLHMATLDVTAGQHVTRGQLIGTLGSTGLSTSPHLHFSVYANGINTDPAPYLARGQA